MGYPSSFLTINNYDLKTTHLKYRRWKFRREDRFTSGSRSCSYGYVTSAAVMRKRLAEAGYDRQSLEIEFAKCAEEIFSSDDPSAYFEARCFEGNYTTAQRVEACKNASLDDWLIALKEHMFIERRFPYTRRVKTARNLPPQISALVDIINNATTNSQAMFASEHLRPTFPCRSLDCMAVAILEVVPDSAECVLDVTSLVDHELIYSFDDLIPEISSTTVDEEEDI